MQNVTGLACSLPGGIGAKIPGLATCPAAHPPTKKHLQTLGPRHYSFTIQPVTLRGPEPATMASQAQGASSSDKKKPSPLRSIIAGSTAGAIEIGTFLSPIVFL